MAKKEVWEIVLAKPAEKVYDKSTKALRQRLDRCFEELEKNPFSGSNIRPLTGELHGLSRYRVGERRIIYRVTKEKRVVEIIAILPRGNAYK